MNLKTVGMVLRQKNHLNEQKFLTLLTPERGLVDAKLKVGGQIIQSVFRNVNVLGYYDFNVFDGRFGCVIDSVEPIEQFFKLRYNPKKLALAQYFCELTYVLVPAKQRAVKHLNLLLNSLWLLEHDKFSCEFVKAVFEFRVLSFSGYMPNLVCCKDCCSYEKDRMFYVPCGGFLICYDCLKTKDYDDKVELNKSVLHAMRYIVYKDDGDIFKFKIGDKNLAFLAKLVENCVLILTEKELVTLKVYNKIKNGVF